MKGVNMKCKKKDDIGRIKRYVKKGGPIKFDLPEKSGDCPVVTPSERHA
jgi:hypothetical protein